MTPEVRRFFFAPSPLIITKANVVSKVHRRAHMDYIGIKTYRADGTPKGEIRVVGLFTSQSYFASPTQVPFLRHKVDAVLAALGYPRSSHDGKAILNILESFPRDELFQIGVKQLREWVDGILDLETRPRVRVFARIDRFDRFVSLLIYVPRDRYTSTVRERIGALLSEVYDGRIVAFYPHFTDGPLVRVQFIVARYAGTTPQVASRRPRARHRRDHPHLGGPAGGCHCRIGRRPRAAREARKQVSRGLLRWAMPRRSRRSGRWRTSSASSGWGRTGRSPSTSTARREGRVHAAMYRFGPPMQLSERVPILENLGFSAIDERTFRVTPRYSDGTREVTLHDMALETSSGDAIDLRTARRAAGRCVPGGPARLRGQRRLQPADRVERRRLARGGHPAGVCRLSAPARLAVRPALSGRHAAPPRRRRARSAGAVPSAPQSGSQGRHQGPRGGRGADPQAHRRRAERRAEPGRGPHPAAVPEPDRRNRAHQLLPGGRRRPAARDHHLQVRRQGLGPGAAAASLPRDLGLLAARGRRAPALRADRARRHPLVGPGAGFPHRDPRAGAGAARQERGDRADRRQGRLPAQADAALAAAATPCRPRASPPTASSSPPCSASPTTSRTAPWSGRRAWCATTATIPTWWWPPTRARRPSPTSPTRSRSRTASGWATPSPRAARPATTTRRWASPRAAPGNASSATSARWTSTSRASPSGWSASATCRATCSATACCCRREIRLVAAFDHRDIFLDPDPDAAAGLAERQRLFDLPRSSWQDYDKAKISKGGGVFSRAAKSIALSVEVQELLGVAGDRADAGRADPRHPQVRDRPALVRRHRHLRARLRRDRCRGRRPRQRRAARHRRRAARQGGRRGRQPRPDAARPHRVRRARRPAQHRLHRQLGRRQHLRPGGQHQDRAGAGGALGPPDDDCPQHAADRDDRRRGGRLAAQQLPAVAGAQPGRAPQPARSAGLSPADARAGGARAARPPAGGAAVGR